MKYYLYKGSNAGPEEQVACFEKGILLTYGGDGVVWELGVALSALAVTLLRNAVELAVRLGAADIGEEVKK